MHIHYESDFTKVFYNLYVLFTNFVLLFFSGYIFYSSIQKQIDSSEKGLKSIYNDQNESELIECGFSNELDYNVFLINQVILKYRDLIQRINYTKREIAMSSHNLTDLWNNTKNAYEQCSTSIDFIKASLDEFSNLSNEIVEKVGNVTSMANMNFNSVAYGVDFITQNIQNMIEMCYCLRKVTLMKSSFCLSYPFHLILTLIGEPSEGLNSLRSKAATPS